MVLSMCAHVPGFLFAVTSVQVTNLASPNARAPMSAPKWERNPWVVELTGRKGTGCALLCVAITESGTADVSFGDGAGAQAVREGFV